MTTTTHVRRFADVDVSISVIVELFVQRLNRLHFRAMRIVHVTRAVRVHTTSAAYRLRRSCVGVGGGFEIQSEELMCDLI